MFWLRVDEMKFRRNFRRSVAQSSPYQIVPDMGRQREL